MVAGIFDDHPPPALSGDQISVPHPCLPLPTNKMENLLSISTPLSSNTTHGFELVEKPEELVVRKRRGNVRLNRRPPARIGWDDSDSDAKKENKYGEIVVNLVKPAETAVDSDDGVLGDSLDFDPVDDVKPDVTNRVRLPRKPRTAKTVKLDFFQASSLLLMRFFFFSG
jgi:hypothetical protein